MNSLLILLILVVLTIFYIEVIKIMIQKAYDLILKEYASGLIFLGIAFFMIIAMYNIFLEVIKLK